MDLNDFDVVEIITAFSIEDDGNLVPFSAGVQGTIVLSSEGMHLIEFMDEKEDTHYACLPPASLKKIWDSLTRTDID